MHFLRLVAFAILLKLECAGEHPISNSVAIHLTLISNFIQSIFHTNSRFTAAPVYYCCRLASSPILLCLMQPP
jgi:hypothetical protein